MAEPIKIALLADASSATKSLDDFGRDTAKAAASADKAAAKVDSSFEGIAESADNVASKGSQLAGALSGLGDLASGLPGPFGAAGQAMVGASVAAQGLADAGDLVNVVTESTAVKQGLVRVRTLAATGATIAASAATKAWTIVQGALNIVLSANPIGLVVIAVAALVAGFVLAYKKSDKFREIVDKAFSKVKAVAESVASFFTTKVPAAFEKVKSAAETALGWVKDHWPVILAILTGPFGLAVLAISKNWDKITDGATAIIGTVKDKFNGLVGFFKGLPGEIGGIFSGLWTGIAESLKDGLNSVLHLPITIPVIDTHIPGIGKIGGQTLIPHLAKGGVVTSPTLALIGEAGPEAVIPLNGRYGVGGGNVYQITVTAPVGSQPAEIGRELVSHIEAYEQAGGRRRAS